MPRKQGSQLRGHSLRMTGADTAAARAYPVVLARSDRGLEVALSAAQIEACGGSPAALIAALGARG
jgi:hypothetical protein